MSKGRIMFATLDLVDTIVLVSKGRRLSGIHPHSGNVLAFQFEDLTEQQASSLLNSTDAAMCRAFHRAWRGVRRQMDAVKLQGGNGLGGGRR